MTKAKIPSFNKFRMVSEVEPPKVGKIFILVVLLLVTAPAFAQSVDTAWVRRYNGSGNGWDIGYRMAVDGFGNVFVTGWATDTIPSNYTTIKYSPNGDTAWVRKYIGSENGGGQVNAITVDGLGYAYVTGSSYNDIDLHGDYTTIKYLPNGDTAWVRRYHGPISYGDDKATALAVDGSGNVYVTGMSLDGGRSFTSWDYATVKYDQNGNELWVRRYDGPNNYADGAQAIALDDSGNVCVTGFSGRESNFMDFVTIKYYPNGDTAWLRRYGGTSTLVLENVSMAVDHFGNIYVAGSVPNIDNYDYLTIKYYPNGDTAWSRKYNGPGNGHDEVDAITIDSSGNVYVTGFSVGSGTDYDYATIKYYPNGDTAWVRRYNGPGDTTDYATAIAVDGSGNVYVTGRSYGIGSDYDYATVKYLPSGDTAWVRRYNGPGNGEDDAYALVVDNSGNVYVTGSSSGDGTCNDYATIKYDPDGNTVWVMRYNEPGDASDVADALIVDNSGNVYVTGASVGIGTSYDYATIKYVQFLCGDANKDGVVDVGDVVYLINYLFKNGPTPVPILKAGDASCDGVVDVGDVVYLINYLFKSGPEPCC